MPSERPPRLGRHRWVGDKRTLVVHDLDMAVASCAIDELVRSGCVATFGPDRPDEARNRGYRPCPKCTPRGRR